MSMTIDRTDETRAGRRRQRTRRRFVVRLLAVLVAGAAIAAGGVAINRSRTAAPAPAAGGDAQADQRTVLIATTVFDDASQQADQLLLLGIQPDGSQPVGLFLPSGTFGQIPGQSSIESIGKALTLGRESLEQVTVENLLGIDIDDTVVLTDVALGQIVEALGGIDIDVSDRLYEVDGQGRETLVFPLGPQHMNGAQAATYFTWRTPDGSDLDRAVRAQQVWEAVLAAGSEQVRAAIAGAADLDLSDRQALDTVVPAFAAAGADAWSFDVLPVESVGAGNLDEVYNPDVDAMAETVLRSFAGSLPSPGLDPRTRARLEIRNGNGTPEIGAAAAAALVPLGFKLEVTGNTAEFDTRSTRIIVYGDDDAALAMGRTIRTALGVGRVEVGTRAQTVVDVTVVLGRDFVDRKA